MKKILKWLIPVAALFTAAVGLLIYVGIYFHADETAVLALNSTETVRVEKTDYDWFFDGPSEDDLLVFYPGAKVEETAYAPLMRLFAEKGMDVCLVKMPLRFAVFGENKASRPRRAHGR